MKVNIIEVAPQNRSFTMFAKPDLNLLRQTKTVRCSIYAVTKTRFSTDLHFGDFCANINLQVEGYKLHENTEWNYFSGKQSTSYYFVKSKTQDFAVYKTYLQTLIIAVMQKMGVELDELTVELECKNF